jgi:hypothetical protein
MSVRKKIKIKIGTIVVNTLAQIVLFLEMMRILKYVFSFSQRKKICEGK